jgi:hypothetical protein
MLHMPVAAAVVMIGEATYRPLARVRDLCIAIGGDAPDPSDVARLLRAAPQLRSFKTGMLPGRFEWPNDPAFAGLVHPWLRSVRVVIAIRAALASVDCGVQLRRLHFPRLQQLIVNSAECSVLEN